LRNVDTALISTRPAQRPVGGDVYVYNYSNATTKGNTLQLYTDKIAVN